MTVAVAHLKKGVMAAVKLYEVIGLSGAVSYEMSAHRWRDDPRGTEWSFRLTFIMHRLSTGQLIQYFI